MPAHLGWARSPQRLRLGLSGSDLCQGSAAQAHGSGRQRGAAPTPWFLTPQVEVGAEIELLAGTAALGKTHRPTAVGGQELPARMGEEDKSAGLAVVHPRDDRSALPAWEQGGGGSRHALVLPSPGELPQPRPPRATRSRRSHSPGQGTHVHTAHPHPPHLASSP